MGSDVLAIIDRFTPGDYVRALEAVQPTEQQKQMLRVHLSAPDQILTARHLASALGFPNWNSANLHYGKFAGKICEALGVKPSPNLSVLVELDRVKGSDWQLLLRPAVTEALLELGFSQHDHPLQEEYGLGEELVEGSAYIVQVSAYERNPIARQRCIAHYGSSCFICSFNFRAAYGDAASGYIHVHHLTPLASIGREYVVDPIADLRPLCANCHSVVHLRNPPYDIDEVRTMMRDG